MNWLRINQYQLKSECGKYSIARANVSGSIWYEAYLLPNTPLGATKVSADASDDEKRAALNQVKQLCESDQCGSSQNLTA